MSGLKRERGVTVIGPRTSHPVLSSLLYLTTHRRVPAQRNSSAKKDFIAAQERRSAFSL